MIGCLLIHGFTGAPYEVEPLAAHLRNETDWKIVVPVLPGHGDDDDLKGIVHTDWIDTAEKALLPLLEECEQVYVVGFSMGGIIAGHLAAKYEIDKLVLLSAAAYYINVKQMASDVIEMGRDLFKGSLSDNELFTRYQKKIGSTPLSATLEFQRLIRKLRASLIDITAPVLIIQGEKDGLIPHKSAEFLYDTISSTERHLFYLPESKHIVCHGSEKDRVIELVELFLQDQLNENLELSGEQ